GRGERRDTAAERAGQRVGEVPARLLEDADRDRVALGRRDDDLGGHRGELPRALGVLVELVRPALDEAELGDRGVEQALGAATARAVVVAAGRAQRLAADPDTRAEVAQQVAPAVGAPPAAHAVVPEGDSTRADRQDRTGPAAQRAEVGGERVTGDRGAVGAQLAGEDVVHLDRLLDQRRQTGDADGGRRDGSRAAVAHAVHAHA